MWYNVTFNTNAESITAIIPLVTLSHSSPLKECFLYRPALNEIPSDNSPLWEGHNKTRCLAVVRGDVHLFGSLTAESSCCVILIKQQTNKMPRPSLLQPECDVDNLLNQSNVLSQLLRLFFILSFCSYYSITAEKGKKDKCDTWQRFQADLAPSVKRATQEALQIHGCNCFAQRLPGQTITCCTSTLSSGLEIICNHLSAMKN